MQGFVVGLFEKAQDLNLFKKHARDFLVQIKEFSGGDDNARLYFEEEVPLPNSPLLVFLLAHRCVFSKEQMKAQKRQSELNVPGLVQPNDPRRDGMQ